MSVHLLGGEARGFTLEVPPESITRPTAVMLKRRLFDWRQDWSGRRFVDLCAGSGAMGFEALSRGATGAWLNEPDRRAYRVLEKNASRWSEHYPGLPRPQLGQRDFGVLIAQVLSWTAEEAREAVLFFDPPYGEAKLYQRFWEAVRGFSGEVWVESDDLKGETLDSQREHLSEVVKEVRQGSRWMLVGRPLPG